MADILQNRRDTAANWTSNNPTLAQGELGYETDTGKYKIGDGSTAWTSLAYADNNVANAPTFIKHEEAALDLGSIAAAGTLDTEITVTGAAVGDLVVASPEAALEAGLIWQAFVSAADTVKLRVVNITAGAIDPAAVDWHIEVLNRG